MDLNKETLTGAGLEPTTSGLTFQINILLYYRFVLFDHPCTLSPTRGTKGQSSLRDILQPLVKGVMDDKKMNINTSPTDVYKAWINQMESQTGEAR